jgi:hypothetical protein
MTVYFATGAALSVQNQLSALELLLNSGTLKIYDGTVHDPDVASITDHLLATFAFTASSLGSFSVAGSYPSKTVSATANFSASTVVAAATFTATWFGLFSSTPTLLAVGTVGLSGADINFNAVAFVSGANITLSSFVISQPE